jgi:AraC-like DNA-binding protein
MYNPAGSGKDKKFGDVMFSESLPPPHLKNIVHRFIEVKTTGALASDYRFHALPDACTYMIFNPLYPAIGGVTRLCVKSEEFNLGRSFHFINIRLLPGVWRCTREQVLYGMIAEPYRGSLPFEKTSSQLIRGLGSDDTRQVLTSFVERLLQLKCVGEDLLTMSIIANLDRINSVAEMAECAGLSPRQLQRRMRQFTGFGPHDFLKILRLQKSIRENDHTSYADQSHFINSFRKATGYTPLKYTGKFAVL